MEQIERLSRFYIYGENAFFRVSPRSVDEVGFRRKKEGPIEVAFPAGCVSLASRSALSKMSEGPVSGRSMKV